MPAVMPPLRLAALYRAGPAPLNFSLLAGQMTPLVVALFVAAVLLCAGIHWSAERLLCAEVDAVRVILVCE